MTSLRPSWALRVPANEVVEIAEAQGAIAHLDAKLHAFPSRLQRIRIQWAVVQPQMEKLGTPIVRGAA
jgi:hypothetical protein